MPVFLVILGVFLIIVGFNDKMKEFGELTREDFSLGRSGFVPWIIAIFVIGALGYIKAIKPIANAFLVLIVITIVIANGGFFNKFTQALKV